MKTRKWIKRVDGVRQRYIYGAQPSKKEFTATADILRRNKDKIDPSIVDDFAEMFERENPRFDKQRFKDYVGEVRNHGNTIVEWDQENYPGDEPATIRLKKEFKNKQEANKWVKDMDKSSRAINRRFDIKSIKDQARDREKKVCPACGKSYVGTHKCEGWLTDKEIKDRDNHEDEDERGRKWGKKSKEFPHGEY